MGDRRRIGPLAAFSHIGKLIAQRRDATLAKPDGDRFHGSMRHARTGPMREHVTGPRLWWAHQKRGDRGRVRYRDLKLLRIDGVHWPLPVSIA
jgi:hypothetical protein